MKKRLLSKFPFLDSWLRKAYYRILFRKEIRLLRGERVTGKQAQSVLHFSLNKAATQFTKQIMKSLCKDQLTPLSFSDLAFVSQYPFLDMLDSRELKDYESIFKPKGFLYTVFSGFVDGIPSLEEYKVVFMVRDPRDLLVSSYYSVKQTHVTPPIHSKIYKEFQSRREETNKLNIDDYVLKDAQYYLEVFDSYQTGLLEQHPNVLILKYEEMITNFDGWIEKLIKYLDFDISEKTLLKIKEYYSSSRPKSEDKNAHNRKGIHGDFRNKLRMSTIKILNEKFRSYLIKFNYPL